MSTTTGPWTTERFGEGERFHVNAPPTLAIAEHHLVAEVYGEANAELIASAPTLRTQNAQLLEALEGLAEACEDVNNPTGLDRAYSTARALIASIKEEQP